MALDRAHIRAHFDRAAVTYADSAVLQARVQDELLARLAQLRPQLPSGSVVLDAGAGPGRGSLLLAKGYPEAHILALDFAPSMLAALKLEQTRRSTPSGNWLQRARVGFNQVRNARAHPVELLCADVERLPLADASVDVLFSSLCIQWIADLPALFKEWARVLKPGGLMLMASFGPDTLKELRSAWRAVDAEAHVNQFMDMHDVGDAILRSGFKNPVLDTELLTLTYSAVMPLLRELKAIGANNADTQARRGLGGRSKLQAMIAHYPRSEVDAVAFDASYEVVYAHAVRSELKSFAHGVEISIPVSQIRRTAR